jgi:2,3,4,5-tetrahydropyridine-2-carboxylate N-succinyltransferase
LYDIVRDKVYRAEGEQSLEVPADAVVVPGSRAITRGKAQEWGLSLYAPVIVKYRDEKTDKGVELEDILR